jgi:hypothetical protein
VISKCYRKRVLFSGEALKRHQLKPVKEKNWPERVSRTILSELLCRCFLQHCSIDSSQGEEAEGLVLPEPNTRKAAPVMATATKIERIMFFLMVMVSAFDETNRVNVTANLITICGHHKNKLTSSVF